MKYYIAKFAVPDEFKPKKFRNADNVDGWFVNKRGLMVSIPANLEETVPDENIAEWEYLFTEEPDVYRCSKCGGFSGVNDGKCSKCGAKMQNGN